jgi:hypothetical protein
MHTKFSISKLILLTLLISGGFYETVFAYPLACSVTTAAACTGGTNTIILRMSASANAHAELSSQSTAGYASTVVCCSGVTGLGNACSGTFGVVAKLAAVTNSHVQQNNMSGYTNNVCISDATAGDSVVVAYQASNCTGYDTTVASLGSASGDNSHIGDGSTYATKICASVAQQSLSFSLSTNTIGFGTLTPSASTYANAGATGSTTEVEAHQISASTNATSGYTITVQGATLTSGANTISAIGGTNTAPAPGTPQYGIRMTATGGTGTVTAPYSASGFAYAGTSTTASQVASASSGTGVATVYSVRYLANVGATTPTGTYSANMQYAITANY